jgi:hypothetical protein
MAAGIYLTLKHLQVYLLHHISPMSYSNDTILRVIILGTKHSRLSPKNYTRIFITCDILTIAIQMTGASLSTKLNLVTTANVLMEIGITLQVVTLLIFGGLAIEYMLRLRHAAKSNRRSTYHGLMGDKSLKRSLLAVVVAYWTIFIRCVYRIAEMAGGWRNPIMQDQTAFIVLDGVMCVIAALALNSFHPGAIFEKSKKVEDTTGEIEMVQDSVGVGNGRGVGKV